MSFYTVSEGRTDYTTGDGIVLTTRLTGHNLHLYRKRLVPRQ